METLSGTVRVVSAEPAATPAAETLSVSAPGMETSVETGESAQPPANPTG